MGSSSRKKENPGARNPLTQLYSQDNFPTVQFQRIADEMPMKAFESRSYSRVAVFKYISRGCGVLQC